MGCGADMQGGDTVATMKPCPRCKRLIPHGMPYCTECAPIREAELEAVRERNAQRKASLYNRRRDPKYAAFYRSPAWKAQSRERLRACGYKCEAKLMGCQGLAVEVHHIKPIQTPEGWDLRLDWENLEAVCVSCHNGRHPEKLRKANTDGVIDLRTIK